MSLKSRYAAFLLLVLALLILFCIGIVQLILLGKYISAVILAVLLYITTYLLGKRFAKIFFVLSLLKLLRKNDGRLSLEAYNTFIDSSLGARRSDDHKESLKKEILSMLEREGIVKMQDNTLLLLG